jgi:hypothetical protein
VRWVLGLLVLLVLVAGLAVAYRAGEGPPATPAGAAEPLAAPAPEPVPVSVPPPEPDDPGAANVRAAPAGATNEPRLETGPDGHVTITNIPDDPSAPRLVREPDGGILMTNQPEE